MKASDITDKAILSAIRVIELERKSEHGYRGIRDGGPPSIWDIQNYMNKWPRKVVKAKLRSMIKRGIIEGCIHNGVDCRGDFQIIEVGER